MLGPTAIYAIFPTKKLVRSKNYGPIVSSEKRWYHYIEKRKQDVTKQGDKRLYQCLQDVFISLEEKDFPLNRDKMERLLSQHHIKYTLL